jgi:hypothetical protein
MVKKEKKILQNVQTRWIFMLSPTKRIVEKYKYLLVQMALDSPTNQQVMLNTFVTSIFFLGLLAFFPCMF